VQQGIPGILSSRPLSSLDIPPPHPLKRETVKVFQPFPTFTSKPRRGLAAGDASETPAAAGTTGGRLSENSSFRIFPVPVSGAATPRQADRVRGAFPPPAAPDDRG